MKALLVVLSALMAALGGAQPVATPIASLDYLVTSADAIAIGTLAGHASVKDQYGAIAVLRVEEALRGKAETTVAFPLAGPGAILARLERSGGKVAVMVFKDQPWHNQLFELKSQTVRYYGRDFKPVEGGDRVLARIREIVRSNPPRRPGFTMPIPANAPGPIRHEQGMGVGVSGLIVPADEQVERYGRRMLRAKTESEITGGLSALQHFKSPKNTRLIKPLLESEVGFGPAPSERLGVTVRHFWVRQRAYDLLKSWGVDVAKPELDSYQDAAGSTTEALVREYDSHTADFLRRAAKLEDVTFYGKPSAELADAVAALPSLRILRFNASDTDDAQVSKFAECSRLEEVWLGESRVTDKALEILAAIPTLRRVNVVGTEVTDAGLAAFRRSRPDVELYPQGRSVPGLASAAARGDVAALQRLINRDPTRIDDRGWRGETALHFAVRAHQQGAMRFLLEAGADPNAPNVAGETPLHAATSFEEVVLLLGVGADPNRADQLGITPLMRHLYDRDNTRILLSAGADPDRKDFDGWAAYASWRAEGKPGGRLINEFAALRRQAIKWAPRMNADCNDLVYNSQVDTDLRLWSTVQTGKQHGPLQWSSTPAGRVFLGPFGQQEVTLNLGSIGAHSVVTIELQLWVIGSWDGNGFGSGPDLLHVEIEGAGVLLHSTFYNNTEKPYTCLPIQSFPDPHPFGNHPGMTGAIEHRTLGFPLRSDAPSEFRRDAVYRLRWTVAHKGDFRLVISGLPVPQNDSAPFGQDETWGIGRVLVWKGEARTPHGLE